MLYNDKVELSRSDIDLYLKELAKEYKKRSGKGIPAEIVLVGGASVLINYGFRQMTTDVDAMYEAATSIKEDINSVGDKFELPRGWLNTDFIKTESYTPDIRRFATHYKSFYQVMHVYTVKAEYLVAMKLRSGRLYKHDMSDVLGILHEHNKKGDPLTFEMIKKAVVDLYGDWNCIPEQSKDFIESMLTDEAYIEKFEEIREQEKANKNALISFEKDNPSFVNQSNVDDVMQFLIEKMKNN